MWKKISEKMIKLCKKVKNYLSSLFNQKKLDFENNILILYLFVDFN